MGLANDLCIKVSEATKTQFIMVQEANEGQYMNNHLE